MRRFLVAALVALHLPVPVAGAHFTAHCRKNTCKRHVVAPHNSHLERMHQCEARGVGWFHDGAFDGGLQFGPPTWSKTGSRYRFAFQAPILEQKYRAVVWAARIGWRWRSTMGWPHCG